MQEWCTTILVYTRKRFNNREESYFFLFVCLLVWTSLSQKANAQGFFFGGISLSWIFTNRIDEYKCILRVHKECDVYERFTFQIIFFFFFIKPLLQNFFPAFGPRSLFTSLVKSLVYDPIFFFFLVPDSKTPRLYDPYTENYK